jgi:hypothetical protein
LLKLGNLLAGIFGGERKLAIDLTHKNGIINIPSKKLGLF